jgi:hypothetical protein
MNNCYYLLFSLHFYTPSSGPSNHPSIPPIHPIHSPHMHLHPMHPQGTISVIAALLAGFGFAILEFGMEPVTKISLRSDLVWMSYIFAFCITFVIVGNLTVSIVLAVSEQQSKVATALSLVHSSVEYNKNIQVS